MFPGYASKRAQHPHATATLTAAPAAPHAASSSREAPLRMGRRVFTASSYFAPSGRLPRSRYTAPVSSLFIHLRSVRLLTLASAALALPLLGGCVRRTISISSEPAGALCWLNGREIGRTPLSVDFLYYGDYDVVLKKDGFEPLLTKGEAKAPLWDTVPFDFVAEVVPGERQSNFTWHYEMQPRDDDPAALLERARRLRDRVPQADVPTTVPDQTPATAPEATPPPAERPTF